MNVKKHLFLFLINSMGWVGGFLLGYQFNYFLDFSMAELFLLNMMSFFAMVPFVGVVVMAYLGGYYRQLGLWFAFYAFLICIDRAVAFLSAFTFFDEKYFFVGMLAQVIGCKQAGRTAPDDDDVVFLAFGLRSFFRHR